MAEKKISKEIVLDEEKKPTGEIRFVLTGREAPIVFSIDKCSEEMRFRLALHGAGQKIGDSYAGAGKAEDPIAYAEEAINDTIAQIYAGDWRVSGTGGPKYSDLALAIARASGKSIEAVHEMVEGLDDAEKKAWRGKAKVKAQLDAIKLERAQAALERAKKAAAAAPVEEEEDLGLDDLPEAKAEEVAE